MTENNAKKDELNVLKFTCRFRVSLYFTLAKICTPTPAKELMLSCCPV